MDVPRVGVPRHALQHGDRALDCEHPAGVDRAGERGERPAGRQRPEEPVVDPRRLLEREVREIVPQGAARLELGALVRAVRALDLEHVTPVVEAGQADAHPDLE
jgi:hypothetical protein